LQFLKGRKRQKDCQHDNKTKNEEKHINISDYYLKTLKLSIRLRKHGTKTSVGVPKYHITHSVQRGANKIFKTKSLKVVNLSAISIKMMKIESFDVYLYF